MERRYAVSALVWYGLIVAALIAVVGASRRLLQAQTSAEIVTTPTFVLGWDQRADSLIQAQGFKYRLWANGAWNAPLAATCSGTVSPFPCRSSALPTFPAGVYSLQLSASDGGVESALSPPLSVESRSAAASPAGLRILP